ncbi:MAG: hypothetical protein ACK5Q5_00245 [Planctomycetaceae bacterium]
MYCNGAETGFQAFQRVDTTINRTFPRETRWMKLSEIARYWAAKGLTKIERASDAVTPDAPFACPDFTLRIRNTPAGPPQVTSGNSPVSLEATSSVVELQPGRWRREGDETLVCWDLSRGTSRVSW